MHSSPPLWSCGLPHRLLAHVLCICMWLSRATRVRQFTSLVHEFDLLQWKDAIISQAKAAKSGQAEERTKKDELWKLGMPKKRGDGGGAERPSLAGLGRNSINARRMLEPTGGAVAVAQY